MKLFDMDGTFIREFTRPLRIGETGDTIVDLKEYVAEACDEHYEDVSIVDRYGRSGDCVEFVMVLGRDVGTLDRPVPDGWVEESAL